MSRVFELSLHRDYVSHWGMAEAVRELIQNALDSDSPFEYLFLYDQSDDSYALHLTSSRATLSPSTLLLGRTSKANSPDAIGSFGEGYKIALLVLTRLGHAVEVLNGAVKWTPEFRRNESYGDDLLCVVETPLDTPNDGLTFVVHGLRVCNKNAITNSCLRMQDDIGPIKRTSLGDILFSRPGKLYVGGLFVCDTDMKFGYNVNPEHLSLERDRQTVSNYDLKNTTKSMWFDTQEFDLIAEMVDEEVPDVEYAEYGPPPGLQEACYRRFRQSNPNHYVARNQAELRSYQARGVPLVSVVSSVMYGLVSGSRSYRDDVAKATRPPLTPREVMSKFLRENRKGMRRGAIVAFKALAKETATWLKM